MLFAPVTTSANVLRSNVLALPCGLSVTGSDELSWGKDCMQLQFIDRANVTMTIQDANTPAFLGNTTNSTKLGVIAGKLTKSHYDDRRLSLNANTDNTVLYLGGNLQKATTSSAYEKRWAKLSTADILASLKASALYVHGVSNDSHEGKSLFNTNVCSGQDHDKWIGISVSNDGKSPSWRCEDSAEDLGTGHESNASVPIGNLQNNIDQTTIENANITHEANADASKLVSVFSGDNVQKDSFIFCPGSNKYALGSCNNPVDGLIIDEPQSFFLGNASTDAPVTSTNGGTSFTISVGKSQSPSAQSGGGSVSPSCDKDANGNCKADEDATLNCNRDGSPTLNWIICPVITLAQGAANKVDSFIMNTLDTDVKPIFDQTTVKGSASQGYYTAWNSFRVLATALLVIGGLVMVASQALGFEFLDAYTVRKVLPRLLVAVIGISLSWPLMRLVVSFFDTAGFDIRSLMYAPFKDFGGTLSVSTGIFSSVAILAVFMAYGFAALTFILTALMGLFVGFIILVIRQIAIIVLIILAPIAIACYILPNTQKVWKLWSENFLGLMLMFPIISALIAAGHIFAAVSLKNGGGDTGTVVAQAIAIIAYIAPYFLLPLAARMATGVIGNLAGVVNDRGKGAFDRLKGVRGRARERRAQEFRSGSLLGGDKIGLNSLGRHYNAGIRGHYGMGTRGKQLLATDSAVQAEQALKNNPRLSKFAQGNDDGNAVLALSGGTRAGAEAAAKQLFRLRDAQGNDLGYDEAAGQAAIKAAAGIGFNRQNASAALIGLGQNKSRAVGAGRADIIREGIDRLAGNNEAMAQEMTGTFAFLSRQSGRADLGGMNWASRGQARTDYNKQAEELAQSYAGSGQTVTQEHKDQAFRDLAMSEGIGRTKVDDIVSGHSSGMKEAMDLSVRMLKHGNAPQRELAATRLLEFQQSLSRASGENQLIINDGLHRAGVSYDAVGQDGSPMGSVAEQLAIKARMDVGSLTRGARTYGEEVPIEARNPAQQNQQQNDQEEH
jgi:hypothetical protein